MTDERKTSIEEWLYAGERLSSKGTLVNAWCEPGGDVLLFKKVHGSMAGHAYSVEVIRDGDTVSVYGSPRYLHGEQASREATPRQVDEWRAETAAARQTVASAQAEKQAAGDDELQEALDVLRRHHKRLTSYAKKGAFASYVLGELQRPARERKPAASDDSRWDDES